jgi:hypothetical protein
MDQTELLTEIKKIATDEGISIDHVIERFEKFDELMQVEFPNSGRLNIVEDHLKRNELAPGHAIILLQKNHLMMDEILEISKNVRCDLKNLGFDIPDYNIFPKKKLNGLSPSNFLCETNWRSKRINVPTIADGKFLLSIAHEHGHSYHDESSVVMKEVKRYERINDYKMARQALHDARYLTEGFCEFIGQFYADFRDKKISSNFYNKLMGSHIRGMVQEDQIFNRDIFRKYYNGLKVYEIINKNHGIDGVRHAALELKSDKELFSFAKHIPFQYQ